MFTLQGSGPTEKARNLAVRLLYKKVSVFALQGSKPTEEARNLAVAVAATLKGHAVWGRDEARISYSLDTKSSEPNEMARNHQKGLEPPKKARNLKKGSKKRPYTAPGSRRCSRI